MARAAVTTMILAASILAMPVLAITQPAGTYLDAALQQPADNGNTATACNQAIATGGAQNGATPVSDGSAPGQRRLSVLIGATVADDLQRPIGPVRDILVGPDNRVAAVVLALDGGRRLVSIPFGLLKIEGDRIVMPGATSARLKTLPEYKYNNA